MKTSMVLSFCCISLAVSFLATQLLSSSNSLFEDAKSAILSTVTRVIDGDTIALDNGETVRLIGIDTPELHHPSRPVEYYAAEAKVFVEQIINAREVRLVFREEK